MVQGVLCDGKCFPFPVEAPRDDDFAVLEFIEFSPLGTGLSLSLPLLAGVLASTSSGDVATTGECLVPVDDVMAGVDWLGNFGVLCFEKCF